MHTEKKQSLQTLDLVYIAFAAVLIAVCSWISIPAHVPFTLQTFAVCCVLSLLGGKNGTFAILLYILLGAIGIPVFSGFGGGLGFLLGNTGGYIVGFILIGLVYWLIISRTGKKLWAEILAMVAGLILCYALGTAWFMVVYARTKGAVSLGVVLGWCVFPFILPDLVKMGLAILLSRRVSPMLKKSA